VPLITQEANHGQGLDVSVIVLKSIRRDDGWLGEKAEPTVVVDGRNVYAGALSQFGNGEGAFEPGWPRDPCRYIGLRCRPP
jgi:hypothetical protein